MTSGPDDSARLTTDLQGNRSETDCVQATPVAWTHVAGACHIRSECHTAVTGLAKSREAEGARKPC